MAVGAAVAGCSSLGGRRSDATATAPADDGSKPTQTRATTTDAARTGSAATRTPTPTVTSAPRETPGTEEPADRDGRSGPTPTATPRGIVLPALDVGGSPGGRVALRPRETVSFVNFFATWCEPCEEEMPDLRKADDYFSEDPVQFVSVTSETDTDAVGQFWLDHEGTWAVCIDENLKATEKYGVNAYPTNMVFRKDGSRVETGSLRTFDEIRRAVERALEESD